MTYTKSIDMSKLSIQGRPKTAEKRAVYDALLDAARVCLKEKSFTKITIREIAEEADTNSAMISYYFGSKGGLFVHLSEAMFDDFHQGFNELMSNPPLLSKNPNRPLVVMLLGFYNKWISVLRVFSSEVVVYNTEMRAMYKSRLSQKLYRDVYDYLEKMVKTGIYRPDLDVKNMAVLLAGFFSTPLHFFPFLAAASPLKIYENLVIQPKEWRKALTLYLDELLLPL